MISEFCMLNYKNNKFNQMKVSRVRQFDNVRNKNLSETNSQANFSLRNSSYLTTNLTSKKDKTQNKKPLCLECVNGRIIKQKKQRTKKEKQEQLQIEKEFQKIQLNQANLQQYRDMLSKQAASYNQKAIYQRKSRQVFQKFQDESIIKARCEIENQKIKRQSLLQQQINHKLNKYREELEKQYNRQLELKQSRKRQKLHAEPEECIIQDRDYRQKYKKYEQQLQKQIKLEKSRKQQLKTMENEIDKHSIISYEKEFLKYTQFSQTNHKGQANPQIFEEMKIHQVDRKIQKIKQREQNQKSRKQELMKAKKQAELTAHKSLKNIKSYASVLSTQIKQKKRQEEYLKRQERQRQAQQLTIQEEHKQHPTKPCGQCCKTVDQVILSYY